MATKKSRCWPGYEPVKGKKQHEQGSCRPKAESKLSTGEKEFRGKRKKQINRWSAEHPGTRRSASQHLSAPGAKKKRAAPTKRAAAKKRPAAKKRTAKKAA